MRGRKLHNDKDSLSTAQLAERWNMSAKYLANHRDTVTPPYYRPTGGKRGAVRYKLKVVEAWEKSR